jgi:hypothetical protein
MSTKETRKGFPKIVATRVRSKGSFLMNIQLTTYMNI